MCQLPFGLLIFSMNRSVLRAHAALFGNKSLPVSGLIHRAVVSLVCKPFLWIARNGNFSQREFEFQPCPMASDLRQRNLTRSWLANPWTGDIRCLVTRHYCVLLINGSQPKPDITVTWRSFQKDLWRDLTLGDSNLVNQALVRLKSSSNDSNVQPLWTTTSWNQVILARKQGQNKMSIRPQNTVLHTDLKQMRGRLEAPFPGHLCGSGS